MFDYEKLPMDELLNYPQKVAKIDSNFLLNFQLVN